MPVDHYENFPVASVLLPRRLRPAVEAIYAFARSADDIADEGQASAEERLSALADYHTGLHGITGQGKGLPYDHPRASLFQRLAAVVHDHQLPLQPFFDLLSAFEQDVRVTRYASLDDLLNYCSRSANPVGRLMLYLYGAATPANVAASDAICTGLQLTNFWQDIAQDWSKGRVYLPHDALVRHGVTEHQIAAACAESSGAATGHEQGQVDRAASNTALNMPANWSALMRERTNHARRLLTDGAPLAARLPGRIGFELRLVVLGGLRILERLDTLNYDVFRHRPTLGRSDWLVLLWRSLNYTRHTGGSR
jgi:squalene synthase HpnC